MRSTTRLRLPLLTAVLLPVLWGPLAGCETVDSTDVDTGGIAATITVVGSADDIEVRASLSVGGLTTVDLEGGDRLTASAGGRSVDLDASESFGTVGYSARLEVDPAPGTAVTVSLDRAAADDGDAPGSVVTLPAPVQVLSPREGSGLRRTDDLVIVVDQAPGDVEVAWDGSCLGPRESAPLFEPGEPVVIAAGSLTLRGPKAPRSCVVTFELTRRLEGDLDGEYDGGSIVAERVTRFTMVVGRPPSPVTPPSPAAPVAPASPVAPVAGGVAGSASGPDDDPDVPPWLLALVLGGILAGLGGYALGRRRA